MIESITILANNETKQFEIKNKNTTNLLQLLELWLTQTPDLGSDKTPPNNLTEYEITISKDETGNVTASSNTGNVDVTKIIVTTFYTDVQNGFINTKL